MSAFLSDGFVTLRPVTRADLPQLAAWRNDPELRARTREFRPLTDIDQENWLRRISGSDRRDFMFVVETWIGYLTTTSIGVVGLCHHDAINSTAEISFYIGDAQARGKGYASKAVQLLQRWGFAELGLRRIYAEVYAFNEPSIKLLKRLGYQGEGRLRSHVVRGGKRIDAYVYGLLLEEWKGLGDYSPMLG